MLPQFKPVLAIIIIGGICFGGETGFLVGAITGFVSNFYFGHGVWTPWQMLAYGGCGMLMGFLFRKGKLARKPLLMGVLGFVIVLLFAGPLLDTCNLFMMPIEMNLQSILAMYGMGFTVNISQSISTFIVLFLLGKPLLGKLDRILIKYGMEERL